MRLGTLKIEITNYFKDNLQTCVFTRERDIKAGTYCPSFCVLHTDSMFLYASFSIVRRLAMLSNMLET
jgi:hypothetical protein